MSLKEVRGWCSGLQRGGPAESRERMQFQQGPDQSESSEGPPVCSGLVMARVWVWRSATGRHTLISCLDEARRDPSYDLTGRPTRPAPRLLLLVSVELGAGTREK